VAAIELFAETGKGDVILMKNIKPPQWRLREGVWRVRFRKHHDLELLEILHIRHRSQAYDR
jgi:mRNA-degrading endonuclease RelE of RelBE toxin-antitoxin system